jgi:hypothetical protein
VHIQIDRSLKWFIENEWIFPSCLHTCTWIIEIISIFLETMIFWSKILSEIQIDYSLKAVIRMEWNFPR